MIKKNTCVDLKELLECYRTMFVNLSIVHVTCDIFWYQHEMNKNLSVECVMNQKELCGILNSVYLFVVLGFLNMRLCFSYLLQMLSSKDINFVGYTYKNVEIVNDDQLPGIGI